MPGTWRTIRVFISSTFRDMQAERDHLVRFVFPSLRRSLLARRIHLVDVDLRWGVTSDQDSLEVCREIVDECRPRFLCILGGRYGWVPPGRDRSITDEEVHYGVLDCLDRHGFAWFYFRDAAATAKMTEPVTEPGLYREPRGSENERKLADLKQSIRDAGLQPFPYAARWDPSSARLIGLKELGDRVYGDLLASIDAELGTHIPEAADEFAEENAAMETFVEERCERFVLGSREPVLQELLAHAGSTGGDGCLCLTGPPGSGKSALLATVYRSYASTHPEELVIPHFAGASPGSADVRRTLRRLCHELKSACPAIDTDVPDDAEKLRLVFPGFLRRACASLRVVILLDAIDQLDTSARSTGLSWLLHDLPPGARIILSALESPALEDLRRGPCKCREIELAPLTPDDGQAIIGQFCRRYRKILDPAQRAALLSKPDAGTPLYLRAALEELRTLGAYEEITRCIAGLPSTTQELFTWILERLENEDGFRDAEGHRVGQELVTRFASLLAASRHGLSQRELAGLLAPGDPQGNVAALLHLLRPYLMRRGELLDFYHRQFRLAAEEHAFKTDQDRPSAHARLARCFDSRRDEPGGRSFSELPYHLAAAGLDAELLRLTGDSDYLQECVARNGLVQTFETLGQAVAALRPGSAAAPQLARQIEVFQGESGSFADWSRDNPVPDFGNQLMNAAARRGHRGLFCPGGSSATPGLPGWIQFQWSLGPRTDHVKERLAVTGTRDSYSWDIYDYGPGGCRTHLYIDLVRHRLLTDTVSTYGSVDAGKFQDTHEPREWDLETGALLARHASQVDDWDEGDKLPRVFEGRTGLTALRDASKVPLPPASELTTLEGEEVLRARALGTSVNSDETVLAVRVRKPAWTFGINELTILWILEHATARLYRTSHRTYVDELNVQAIIRLASGLAAFATDRDGHVYRLSLVPAVNRIDEAPVLDAALPEGPGELACVRATGIEIRTVADNQIVQAFGRDDMTAVPSSPDSAPRGPLDNRRQLLCTADRRWLIEMDDHAWPHTRIDPWEGDLPARNRVLSARTGELTHRPWEAPKQPTNSDFREKGYELFTRSGKYRLVKKRCTLDVWEVQSGRWLGTLGPGPRYGGGGSLYGVATHPNERFVISSDTEGGSLVAWDLEKDCESWRLGGIRPLGKIHLLTFLWGGYLVAALTEDHFLYVLRFWWQSEILAAVRVDRRASRIVGMPFGDSILVLCEDGSLDCYRYVPRQAKDVTSIDGDVLNVRYRAAGAKSVHLAGTFNGWNPAATALQTDDGEHWHAAVRLPDGRHELKLVIDGQRWELDPNVPFVPREYGPNNYVDLRPVRSGTPALPA